jgi:hypothetical protein
VDPLVDGGVSQKRNPRAYGAEKSDSPIAPKKPPNKPALGGAEDMEGRGLQLKNIASFTYIYQNSESGLGTRRTDGKKGRIWNGPI